MVRIDPLLRFRYKLNHSAVEAGSAMIHPLRRALTLLAIGLAFDWCAGSGPAPLFAEPNPVEPKPEAPLVQILRAPDWKGGVEESDGECGATAGEYSYWVYATADRCGVPRARADRVVSIRQPIPGMAPLSAGSQLPGGRYAVWAYGMGQPGHPWVSLCAKTCARGAMPPTSSWVFLDWIEIRDDQNLHFRTYEQPDGHRLHVQAVVLSSSERQPDWVP